MMPNSGPRKSWAAADATARATWLALLTMRGEMGYPTALTAKTWGFYDVLYPKGTLEVRTPYKCRVISDIQFKISVPAQRHSWLAGGYPLAPCGRFGGDLWWHGCQRHCL